jgi:hypothetical protein
MEVSNLPLGDDEPTISILTIQTICLAFLLFFFKTMGI